MADERPPVNDGRTAPRDSQASGLLRKGDRPRIEMKAGTNKQETAGEPWASITHANRGRKSGTPLPLHCSPVLFSKPSLRKRRGRDSNPRDPNGPTPFPRALLKPLGHLSGVRSTPPADQTSDGKTALNLSALIIVRLASGNNGIVGCEVQRCSGVHQRDRCRDAVYGVNYPSGQSPRGMNAAARARNTQHLHGDARATEIEMHPVQRGEGILPIRTHGRACHGVAGGEAGTPVLQGSAIETHERGTPVPGKHENRPGI